MRVRVTQIDGKLPNLALMKLSHWHKARGDEVVFTRQAHRDLTEWPYDIVYGSAIFKFSADKIAREIGPAKRAGRVERAEALIWVLRLMSRAIQP